MRAAIGRFISPFPTSLSRRNQITNLNPIHELLAMANRITRTSVFVYEVSG